MLDALSKGFRIGDRRVEPTRGQIIAGSGAIHVEPRAMDVLVALAARPGDTISRDDLILAVWKHSHVTDEALTRCISVLRQALGDDGARPRLIETVPKRGYRLVATVEATNPAAAVATDVAPDWSKTNVGLPLARIIGRERELTEIRALLATHRLVTLTGSAGVGKTRLGVEIGRQSLAGSGDGVWLVDLAPLSDPALISSTMALLLGIELGHTVSPLEELARRIGQRRLLLILDNCEHLVDEVAALAETILGIGPEVRILATSQALLNIAGEQAYRVPSLTVPADDQCAPDELLSTAAVQLFIERAKAIDAHFGVDPADLAAIAATCRQLDGIPLAIEMAAARAPLLGVEQVAMHLDERLRLLTGGRRTALPRHQTLRATLDWSFNLLEERERNTLTRLGVFAGSFTLEAASAILSDRASDKLDVVDVLTTLVARSLVVSEPHATGVRYRLLQTTRTYALEQLEASGASNAVRNRHLRHYLDKLIEVSPNTRYKGNAFDGLHLDRENILAAHAWCDHAPDGGQLGLKLAFELKDYWVHRGGLDPGYRITTEALARPDAQERNQARAWTVYAAALLASVMRRYDEALAHREECLSIARELGHKSTIVFALLSLGEHHVVHRQWPEARRYIAEALPLAREHNGRNEVHCALLALGDLERLEGHFEAAQACNEECLALARASNDPRLAIVVLNNLTCLSLARGVVANAPSMLLESLDNCEEIGSRALGPYTLAIASGLAAVLEEAERAARLHVTASRLLDEIGFPLEPADEAFLAPLRAKARESLAGDALVAAEQSGRALSYEAATAETRAWLKTLDGQAAEEPPADRSSPASR